MINITDYTTQALMTVKDHTSKEMAIADWALGLGGETGEVIELLSSGEPNKMELAKELGDILWYTIALANEVNINFPSNAFEELDIFVNRSHCTTCLTDTNPRQTAVLSIMTNTCAAQEKMKHAIMHKEGYEGNSIEGKLSNILAGIATVAKHSGFTLYNVAELNAAKLAHRYNVKNGGQYSVAASADRHATESKFEDTAEFKALYQAITGLVC